MSLTDLAEIPGYAEAQKREQATRDLSFCEWEIPLCGMRVKQFSLLHLLVLGNCDNAFVAGRSPEPEDVALFLWVVSPEYRPNDDRARDRFVRSMAKRVKFIPACAEIMKFLDEAFMDSPGGSGAPTKSYTSFAATFCDVFACEYGWDDQATMSKPVARLFQLLRKIKKRHNPQAIEFNRSDAVLSEYLRKQAAN